LKYSVEKLTPRCSKKPDAKVLNTIIDYLGLIKPECVYVGDNIMKDIGMAHHCGIEDVWAKYGVALRRPEYTLLRDVSHWTAEEVEREQKNGERGRF
jgi:FMN phosphatase YigB (HAD superfamily)